jgi:hypothetical protein
VRSCLKPSLGGMPVGPCSETQPVRFQTRLVRPKLGTPPGHTWPPLKPDRRRFTPDGFQARPPLETQLVRFRTRPPPEQTDRGVNVLRPQLGFEYGRARSTSKPAGHASRANRRSVSNTTDLQKNSNRTRSGLKHNRQPVTVTGRSGFKPNRI